MKNASSSIIDLESRRVKRGGRMVQTEPGRTSITVRDAVMSYPVGPFLKGSIKSGLFRLIGYREADVPDIGYIKALSGLSFSIAHGERVGIIGRNGSGKSTLLRALAGVYPLDSGEISVQGRIQSIFEIGIGFESEATGRENIVYRGLVMGVSPKAIEERMEDIISFADLGDFIDLPMRTYSSGMWVRLAFAISSYLDGDVLLIDEVFGAGDASFVGKAIARMEALVESAGIVVFVSHDVHTLQRLCPRTIWMGGGKILMDGPSSEVVQAYLAEVGG
jgi:lipopolysaccharide transport system ATP-binding protein